jgi:ribonuclease P protein subunit RPR2
MGKKTKDQVPNANSVPNRDIIQRLNFLYQASVYLDALPTASVSNEHLTLDSMITKTKRPRRSVNAKDLSRSYIRSMKIVGQKTTVKMLVTFLSPRLLFLTHGLTTSSDPTVKRTLCRGCDAVLVPGTTASVRVKREMLPPNRVRPH